MNFSGVAIISKTLSECPSYFLSFCRRWTDTLSLLCRGRLLWWWHLYCDGTRRVRVLVDKQHKDGTRVTLEVDLIDLLRVRRLNTRDTHMT